MAFCCYGASDGGKAGETVNVTALPLGRKATTKPGAMTVIGGEDMSAIRACCGQNKTPAGFKTRRRNSLHSNEGDA